MKGVIWILACVVLVGCESRRLDAQRVESSRGGVTRELATAVRRALEAKRVEEGRLVQYGVEKQRLVSLLAPLDVEWAVLHPLAVEDYVTERDVEAAKNLCVVLELERHASDRKRRLEDAIVLGERWLEAGRLYRISGAEAAHHEDQGVELFVVIEQLKDLVTAPPPEPPLREIDGASLKREFARVEKREQELAEAESEMERQQQLQAAVDWLRDELSRERNTTAVLRDQLARVEQQNQRLQDEHRQSVLSVRTLERELMALKADLDQEREKVVRLTRESPTPVSTVRKTIVHVDQTPRPMAPYGYWASPSGYRYGGRW